MPKKYQVWTLTFFGASSSNFFNKGLPNKILMFLILVLIPLSNDTTFLEKNYVAFNLTFSALEKSTTNLEFYQSFITHESIYNTYKIFPK